uniref:Ubiquitin-like domain-containing protein n=1 Tax=Oryzias latipes TaxID=8090 RepID=A0A3B3HP41_ORYLA
MNQGVMDSPVTLVIKAPNQKYDDQKINCHPNWTVEKLKAHLSDVYPSKPISASNCHSWQFYIKQE